MESDQEKRQPSGNPGRTALSRERLQQAVEDPDIRERVRMRLIVSGGFPGETEPFTLQLDGRGQLSFAQLDADAEISSRKVDGAMVARLLRRLDAETLLAARARARIPPDSLVGRFEISIGDESHEVVFMADKEQARTAGFEVPPGLEQLVEELLKTGRDAFGKELG